MRPDLGIEVEHIKFANSCVAIGLRYTPKEVELGSSQIYNVKTKKNDTGVGE